MGRNSCESSTVVAVVEVLTIVAVVAVVAIVVSLSFDAWKVWFESRGLSQTELYICFVITGMITV